MSSTTLSLPQLLDHIFTSDNPLPIGPVSTDRVGVPIYLHRMGVSLADIDSLSNIQQRGQLLAILNRYGLPPDQVNHLTDYITDLYDEHIEPKITQDDIYDLDEVILTLRLANKFALVTKMRQLRDKLIRL